ncbi:hypothetical protein BGZ61DRAFT_460851 [Ilyonectria robusta]|uniref:uncharacterized protein n=1 Tax=Ilyonectria robusta TaxID=1079257 RepID=UPI001E8EA268|nr:uncharacterized protein BGZ61DRAFT_460851 [Ilyonectria robusta]KAH8669318.1 hypothetical protein BGZ61DRAFT_460851 [Ilyonectria robusta]
MRLQETPIYVHGTESSGNSTSLPPPRNRQKRASHDPFDPELHYGEGDDGALYNLFATWPENYFSSLPRPHGNRGIDEPWWKLRQTQIFLDDCFRGRGERRLFVLAIPDPDKLERERLREQLKSEDASGYARSMVRFKSALKFAREQAKSDTPLALELAKHCQSFGPRRVGDQ